MDTKDLQNEIIKIRQARTSLEPYKYRRVEDLPPQLKEQIATIKIIPALTSGGIESVLTVLTYLDWAQELAEEEIEKRDNQTSETSSQNTQKEIEPPKTITDIKSVNIKAPEHISVEIENRPTSDEARIVQRETDNVKNNDENRQSINESDIISRETNNELTNQPNPTEAPKPVASNYSPPFPILRNAEVRDSDQHVGTKLNPGIKTMPELPFSIEELIEENRQQIKRYEKILENAKVKSQKAKENTITEKIAMEQSSNKTIMPNAKLTNQPVSNKAIEPFDIALLESERPRSRRQGRQLNNNLNFPTNISAATTPVKAQEHADIETNNRPTSDEARIGLRQTSTSARPPRLGEAGARRDGSDESGIDKQEANTESTNNQATQEPKKSNPNQLPKPTTVDHASLPSVSSKPRMSLPQKENVKQITPQEKANPAPAEIDFGPYYQK